MDDLRPTLLLTRPIEASRNFWHRLSPRTRASVHCLESPLMRIEQIGDLPDLDGFSAILFTSANAVRAFAGLGGSTDLPSIAVGEGTAAAARAFGLRARSVGGDADRLVMQLIEEGISGPLLHVRGRHSVGDIAQRLAEAGVTTETAVVYDQVLQSLTEEAKAALSQDKRVIVPLFSPRTAARFAEECPRAAGIWVGAISEAVARKIGDLGVARCETARRPDGPAMAELTERLVKQAVAVEQDQASK